MFSKIVLDPVYTVPDSHSHDIEFGQFELIFTLLETIQFDIVTMWIRYRVNGVLGIINRKTPCHEAIMKVQPHWFYEATISTAIKQCYCQI